MNVFNIRLVILLLFVACTRSKTPSAANKLLDKEGSIAAKCKSTNFDKILNLRAQESNQKLLPCLIKSLNSAKGDGFLWSLLGEAFARKGERSKANVCFKESIRLMGKLSKYIKKWHYIGPLTIGKNEIDGDPLEDFNGIRKLSKNRWVKDSGIYYSELRKGGEIQWSVINMNTASEPISIPSNADWNELILSLQSLGIAEWQGWIVGDFVVNEDSTVLIQCLGASTVYVNDIVITGDLYKRSELWHPVHLKRGIHSVMIKLRSKATLAIHFHLKPFQEKSPFAVLNPPFLPDLINGRLFSNFISLNVQNLHHSNWLQLIKVSSINRASVFKVSLYGDSRKFLIAPGQIKSIIIRIDYKDKSMYQASEDNDDHCKDTDLNFKLSFKGKDEKVNLILRCRKMSESFLFTFVDHDGSLQHGAAIAPLKGCSSGVCPVLLTLHGTTVPPQSQADSYKRMENGKWVFGLDNLWVLAPTRHGAHNWEGPGELTAMKALESLSSYTRQSPFITSKADSHKMVVSGHSMGGHGAWIIGTHYPDRTLALISGAGWIRKEDYGDSNLFFRHDVSTSHVSPAVKMTMEACIAENDVDKHVSNLHGLPIMIRTGGADRTVHPYYSRRMYRLLRQQRSNVTYHEIPGKEHWWWDTYKTNDGGVTNDPIIRGFAIKHAKHTGIVMSNDVCDKEDQNCGKNSANKYQKQDEKEERIDRNLVNTFTLTVYNPASNYGVRGVRIIQQMVPFRKSTVQINLLPGSAVLSTDNVVRITLSEVEIFPMLWHQRLVKIDDDVINIDRPLEKSFMSLCRPDGNWKVCQQGILESKFERGPLNVGPARRVAESPFLIVTGTARDTSTTDTLRQLAIYIANQFHLTSDAIAHVTTDKDLDEETAKKYNLIVIGSPEHNTWTSRFHDNIPLKYTDNGIELRNCRYKAIRTGALFLAPHAENRLVLVLTGNSLLGIQDVVQFATPTILPMARSPFSNMVPDFIVTGPDFGARGPGGYLCTGFWGNRWEYKQELVSCSC